MDRLILALAAALASTTLVGCSTSTHTCGIHLEPKQDALVKVMGSHPTIELNAPGPATVIATIRESSGNIEIRTLRHASFAQTLRNGGEIHLKPDGDEAVDVQLIIQSASGLSIDRPAPRSTEAP